MTDTSVGIDIGTSYTKCAARREDGTIVTTSRSDSPTQYEAEDPELIPAYGWWRCLRDTVDGLCLAMRGRCRIKSICVSGIAPTLTVFDRVDHRRAYSIMYSAIPEGDNWSSLGQSDSRLTARRLEVLKSTAYRQCFERPAITDLVGYLNWCMTGELTINSLSLAEMGCAGDSVDTQMFSVNDELCPRLVAPIQQIGETGSKAFDLPSLGAAIPVCGGCPDTMGSVVGAGITGDSEAMLYLGTFGSLMYFRSDVRSSLRALHHAKMPFDWRLSVPFFGPHIESLCREWFGSGASLQQLDCAALAAPAGANGSLFLLPRWKSGMRTTGKFSFAKVSTEDVSASSRAVLESMGYAVMVADGRPSTGLKLAGGGARSRAWCEILATVLGIDICARDMAWEAAGTSDIAAELVWQPAENRRPFFTYRPDESNHPTAVQNNFDRACDLYGALGWI